MSSKSKQRRKEKRAAPRAQFIPLAVWGDLSSLGLNEAETIEFLKSFKVLQDGWLKRYGDVWKQQHDEMLKELTPLVEKYKAKKGGAGG